MSAVKKNNFHLFTHEEIEVKNALLNESRNLSKNEQFGSRLASAMIYVSLTEYLAQHLLENLSYLVYKSTYIDYAAILYIDERSKSGKQTLGQLINNIKKYSFPDKNEVIEILGKIAKSRNHLFHNLAKTSLKDWPELDKDIKEIQEDVEQFIEKINIISSGLQKILIPQDKESE